MELKDKVVVITGGSKGFGFALAKCFLEEGAKVSICGLNESELKIISDKLNILGVVADVRVEADLQNFLDQTVSKYGTLDVWVNNAGIWMGGPIEDADMNQVKKMFDINVIGLMNGTRVALKYMNLNKSGTIINISSRAGLGSRPDITYYSASKWAVTGFTKGAREEYKDRGIKFYGVYPGGMKTGIFGDNVPSNYDTFLDVDISAKKVLDNIKLENGEEDLVLARE